MVAHDVVDDSTVRAKSQYGQHLAPPSFKKPLSSTDTRRVPRPSERRASTSIDHSGTGTAASQRPTDEEVAASLPRIPDWWSVPKEPINPLCIMGEPTVSSIPNSVVVLC